MAYFWLLIMSDAAAFSSFSLRATSSLSSSFPGEFELEFASEAAADATTAPRAAGSLPRGHLAVLGLRPIHAAVGAGDEDLTPAHCILLSLLPKPNPIGSKKVEKKGIEFSGTQMNRSLRFLGGRRVAAQASLPSPPLKLGAALALHFCGSAAR